MAQGYRCDWEGHDAPADVVVTMLGSGDVSAYCGEHYMLVCRLGLAQMDAADAEADATAADAVARLEDAPTPLAARRRRGAEGDKPASASVPGEAAAGPADAGDDDRPDHRANDVTPAPADGDGSP